MLSQNSKPLKRENNNLAKNKAFTCSVLHHTFTHTRIAYQEELR